jgi:hypothetical protein
MPWPPLCGSSIAVHRTRFQDIPLPLAHLDFSHPGRALWWNDHLTVLPHSYLNFAQIAGALGEVRKSPSVGC